MTAQEPLSPTLSPLRIASQGNLVASTVDGLRRTALEALETSCSEVVLDLESADVVDSLGITLMLGLFKTCQQKNLPFRVEGASSDLMRVFRLFSLPRLFTITEK